jgi:hypothetical protein
MTIYKLPRRRAKFIEDHFFQWSFNRPDDFPPNSKAFSELSHPAELHYLASIYNWDDGPEVLEWIVGSPLCSRSTANLIFWRAAPDYYLRFDLESAEGARPSERSVLFLLRKIVLRYRHGGYSGVDIEFDPDEEIEDIMTEDPKWTIPDEVYDRIDGIKIRIANTPW